MITSTAASCGHSFREGFGTAYATTAESRPAPVVAAEVGDWPAEAMTNLAEGCLRAYGEVMLAQIHPAGPRHGAHLHSGA